MTQPYPNSKAFMPGTVQNLSRCWEEVLHLGIREQYRKGSIFSFTGSRQGNFAYVRKGRLACLHSNRKEKRIIIFVENGSLFNETYAISGYCEATPTHHCQTDVELYSFDKELLLSKEFFLKYPHLIRNCLFSIAYKLASYDAIHNVVGSMSPIERVAWYLCSLYKYKGTLNMEPNLTQMEVAMLLGLHKSSMTRVMKILKEKCIVSRFTKSQICISDINKLFALADHKKNVSPYSILTDIE